MEWFSAIYLFLISAPFLLAIFTALCNPKRAYFIFVTYFSLYFQLIHYCFGFALTAIDNQATWSATGSYAFRVQLRELPKSHPISMHERRTLMLFNHVSAADFLVHDLICEHQANYLSSFIIAILFPLTWITTQAQAGVFYFVRGGRGHHLEPFFRWVDGQYERYYRVRHNLIAYPEGHRNLKRIPLPLKHGMIRYAFERRMLVQITMAFGVDDAVNEKAMKKNFCPVPVEFRRCAPIDPDDYESIPEFYKHVSTRFMELYDETLEMLSPELQRSH